MNDDSNTLHPWIAPELEARLTALVLGEASDFERDELERLVVERPELGLYRKRLEAMHRMLREVATVESEEEHREWKLSGEKRAVVLERLGSEAVPLKTALASSQNRSPRSLSSRILAIAAAVMIVGLVLGLMFPASTGALRFAGSGKQLHSFGYTEGSKDGDQYFRESAQPERELLRAGDVGVVAGGDLDLARGKFQPAQREWQRNPGHSSVQADTDREATELALPDRASRPAVTSGPAPADEPTVVTRSGQVGALNGTVAIRAGGDLLVSAAPEGGTRISVAPVARPPLTKTPSASGGGDWGKSPIAGTQIKESVDLDGGISAGYMSNYVFQGDRAASAKGVDSSFAFEGANTYTGGTSISGGSAPVRTKSSDQGIGSSDLVSVAAASSFSVSNQDVPEIRDVSNAEGMTLNPSMTMSGFGSKAVGDASRSAVPRQTGVGKVEGEKSSQYEFGTTDIKLSESSVTEIPREILPPRSSAPAAKPMPVAAPPASGPVVVGESVVEEKLKKTGAGHLDLNGFVIDLERSPEVVEFDGFINYGAGVSGVENPGEAFEVAESNFALPGLQSETKSGLQKFPLEVRAGAAQQTAEIEIAEPWQFGRRAELDQSVQEILGLTPQVGHEQTQGIDSRNLHASTGTDGVMRSSGGRVTSGTVQLGKNDAVDKSLRDILALTPQVNPQVDGGGIAPVESAPTTEAKLENEKWGEGKRLFLLGAAPVKLDYAFPLGTEGTSNTDGRFNFTMGADFGSPKPTTSISPAKLRQTIPAALDETSPETEPFSTFSLHVSDVSFQLAKAALAAGQWPEATQIRIEEFVNAFDYGDPMPGLNDRVACRVDQAIHPFLQQRNLLRIAMRTAEAGRAADTPLRLTVLLDNSGSMERPDRSETVRRAFATLADQLQANDQITLISFARQPRLVADAYAGEQAGQLVELVSQLPSEGGTNLEAALQLAFEKAQEHRSENSQNRIVLLTDGAANLGDAKAESLSSLIESMRESGIAFDAAGVGAEGLNDEILEALTRKGDGRYYLLDQPEDAEDGFAKQIAGALRPAAKNVKVQVEFNPRRVESYRLLGFEKHRLETEDFRNDAVDAAEMAAAEAGVAVYQVEPKADGEGDIGSVSVRFQDLDTDLMVEKRWPIPYLTGTLRPEQAGAAIQLATVASQFAAKLKGGPLGDVVDLGELARLAAALPDGARVAELRTMIEQARRMEGAK